MLLDSANITPSISVGRTAERQFSEVNINDINVVAFTCEMRSSRQPLIVSGEFGIVPTTWLLHLAALTNFTDLDHVHFKD